MKIGLCTPSRSGYVHHDHMKSVIETVEMARASGFKLNRYFVAGCSLIARARNTLVAAALSDDCDYVFFVDDDIGYDPKDFFRLVDYGVDVAAGAPARRAKHWKDGPLSLMRLTMKRGLQKIQQVNFEGGHRLWQAEGLSTGFMAIKADVFKKLEPVTDEFISEGEPPKHQLRTWFWVDLVNMTEDATTPTDQGEDYNFCFKWRLVGGDCFVDPDIRLRHYDGNVCHDYCPADMEAKRSEFTVDWVSHNIPTWERVLAPMRDADCRILEIGSWEGRSAKWFLDYLPQGKITCVDTFAGSDEHRDDAELPLVEKRFDANLAAYAPRLEKIKKPSQQALPELGAAERRFDLIYVDGSHRAADVFADAIGAWPLLNDGGIMIFDDYEWRGAADYPKPGIDAFLAQTDHEVVHVGYQMIIRKAKRNQEAA